MAKNKRKKPVQSREQQKVASSRRKFLEKAITIGGVILVSGVGYAAYRIRSNNIYDLDVIGNGSFTVVQIHDPGCDSCKMLLANVESIHSEFKDIQFRVVNILYEDGAKFANQYNAKKTTLLIFNPDGELIDKLEGIFPPDNLRKRFLKLTT
jgi:hypothetical protein